MNIAIPIHGKMSMRSFHCPEFLGAMEEAHVYPIYFLGPIYYGVCAPQSPGYRKLKVEDYQEFLNAQRYSRWMPVLRRFLVRTETTDLRLRTLIESGIYTNGITFKLAYGLLMDIMRRAPGMAELTLWYEDKRHQPQVHENDLRDLQIQCILSPGFGSYGFEYEGFFAREAKRLGIPVFTNITNYDNIVNRGLRGFMPDCVTVWSKIMADDAMKLQKIPANRIEVTGPVQFDNLMGKPKESREAFLKRVGLDPSKKTILYAGGVNITRYFEIYRLITNKTSVAGDCNVVIRPYPHQKLRLAPAWQLLEKLFSQLENVYMSFPWTNSEQDLVTATLATDFVRDDDVHELHCLLKHTDVLINSFSTISLEAAICDLPMIHLGYDLHTYGQRYILSTDYQRRQTHNRRELRLKAAKVVENEDELIIGLEQYLSNPGLDREARLEYALSECSQLDGGASKRLIEIIKNGGT